MAKTKIVSCKIMKFAVNCGKTQILRPQICHCSRKKNAINSSTFQSVSIYLLACLSVCLPVWQFVSDFLSVSVCLSLPLPLCWILIRTKSCFFNLTFITNLFRLSILSKTGVVKFNRKDIIIMIVKFDFVSVKTCVAVPNLHKRLLDSV